MTPEEKERIDRITQVVHYLSKGKMPDPIPCEQDPDDEIRQLCEKVNTLSQHFIEVKEFIVPLSCGKLDGALPKRNFLASPFKQLQSALNHLTWQTQQIAKGDFSQRVDFMGDFSMAFNSMTDSLKEARSQLMSEIARFKELAEIKEKYLNVMAHDIRTPIGAVIGFSEILLEEELGEKARKYVEIIRRNSDSLLGLINNILDMAKLEKRRMDIESVPFSIRILTEDIENIIQSKLAQGVGFIRETDSEIPEYLSGDPYRLQQVLTNLVGNAAKFTQQGSITLSVKISAQNADEFALRFSVRDTGMGIAQDKLETIFMPFSQADAGIASRFGGTGLGLTISRELVSLMGSELRVESRLGEGTEFSFTLSLRRCEKKEDIRNMEDITPCSKRCNILVVDDNPDTLKIIESALKKHGVRFTLCQDSRKAFDLLVDAYRQKDPFTLAWLDIDMPGLSGVDLAKKIRADHNLNRLRLVACTSHIEEAGNPDSPSHFSFVASKPITPQALKRILEEAGAGYPVEDSSSNLNGLKLLIVDDNPLNRFLVINVMKKLNIEVIEAENGLDAVNKISENKFDAVLMDRMMPVMDGAEAIRRIREIYDPKTLPILAFTASDSQEDKNVLMSAGANGIVFKPIVYENIVENLCRNIFVK